jgi:hypothetical protein
MARRSQRFENIYFLGERRRGRAGRKGRKPYSGGWIVQTQAAGRAKADPRDAGYWVSSIFNSRHIQAMS